MSTSPYKETDAMLADIEKVSTLRRGIGDLDCHLGGNVYPAGISRSLSEAHSALSDVLRVLDEVLGRTYRVERERVDGDGA